MRSALRPAAVRAAPLAAGRLPHQWVLRAPVASKTLEASSKLFLLGWGKSIGD